MSSTYDTVVNELRAKKVDLIAVSKKNPVEAIQTLFDQGQRDFGENHVQELIEKASRLPNDIRWHMIGHLQKNKVRQILPITYMIQSVDSEELLYLINLEAEKISKKANILLEIKIAEEDTKYGFEYTDLFNKLNNLDISKLKNIVFCGVMGMASFSDDLKQVEHEFNTLKKCFDELKEKIFFKNEDFRHISMGMSGDYKIAVAAGSTMVRIGSLLFGKRM